MAGYHVWARMRRDGFQTLQHSINLLIQQAFGQPLNVHKQCVNLRLTFLIGPLADLR